MPTFKTLDERQRYTMGLLSTYADRLPLLPGVARTIRALRQGEPELPERIEMLARFDPALAVRMLYIANHTFNVHPDREVTLSSVIVNAGSDRIAASVRHVDESHEAFVGHVAQRDLWLHAIQVAMAAKFLVPKLREPRPSADAAYLYGLLHDIGRLVMLAIAPAIVQEVNGVHWTSGAALVATEVEVCGFDHGLLGWLACRTWNFPETLALVNKYHHGPDALATLPLHVAATVRLIALADELSLMMTKDDRFMASGTSERLQLIGRSKVGLLIHQLGIDPLGILPFVGALDGVSRARLRQFEAGLERWPDLPARARQPLVGSA